MPSPAPSTSPSSAGAGTPRRARGAPDERELVARAAGDPEAFATLYRLHAPAIQRYVRRRLGDRHLVEDVVAETFLCALEGLPRYVDRGLPFRAWLYRLAVSRIGRRRRRAALARIEELEREGPDRAGSDGADRLDAEARTAAARRALLRLRGVHQDALSLHYLEGLSVGEVARALGCREGTVKSRLARGREALRRQLTRMGWTA